jgi:cytochrome c
MRLVWIAVVALLAIAAYIAGSFKNNINAQQWASQIVGGSPQHGKDVIPYYGCPSCHTIPGIRQAEGLVGPPLAGVTERMYIAGTLPNNPDNLVRWIRGPQEINPKTDMPNMAVTESDARDIAAYLLSLR